MESSLTTALTITVIGMSLLFLSLVAFYGLLSLLAAATKDRRSPAERTVETGVRGAGDESRDEALLRVAAVAIALARARAERMIEPEPASGALTEQTGGPAPTAADQQVSPWWALHHQRQMALKRDR